MKPSGRFKKRYVSFSLMLGDLPPVHAEAKKILHEHFLSFFGESGVSALAFKLMEYDARTGRGAIRCARDKADDAVFCMALLSEWAGRPCRLEPLSTSGSTRRL